MDREPVELRLSRTAVLLLGLEELRSGGIEYLHKYRQPRESAAYRIRFTEKALRETLQIAERELSQVGERRKGTYPATGSRTLRRFIREARRKLGEEI